MAFGGAFALSGLTGKQNIYALLTHMLLCNLDVLNGTKHTGLIQP